MENVKFGATGWDEKVQTGKDRQNRKDEFLKLVEGSNVLRIVTMPYQYITHRYKDPADTSNNFGDKINCSGPNHGGQCPVCDQKSRPKVRWLLGVIDRKSGQYRILDIGQTIYLALQKYARTDRYGNPQKYDIDIVVDPSGGATGYYMILPFPPEPMSSEDLKIVQSIDTKRLEQLITPPDPEWALKRLNSCRERRQLPALQWTPKSTASQPSKPVEVDGANYDFPVVSADD